MKKIFIFLLLNFFVVGNLLAQKENNIWVGGDFAGIDFNSGSPIVFSRTDNNNIWRTNASICDKNGNLLFYTNGYRVFNRNFQIMQNGNNLNIGDYVNFGYNELSVADGAAIVPVPNDSNKFYLFHTDLNFIAFDTFPNQLMSTHLFYDVIDMSLAGGLGGIVSNQKEIILLSDTLTESGMKVIKHANGRDYWLINHEAGTNKYYRFLIDPSGIHGPFYQNVGIELKGINSLFGSNLVFNSDGSRAAQIIWEMTIVQLFDFNRCNGEFENPIDIHVSDTTYELMGGIAFSPSNKYLYVTAYWWSYIWQFDVTASDVSSSRILIAKYDTTQNPFPTDFDKLCLAPDGKIYVCSYAGNRSLHIINYPDSAGAACGFVENGFSVYPPGINWGGTFPNQVNYSLGAIAGSACDTLNDTTVLPIPEFTWSIYPNPFTEDFQLSITGAETDVEVSIYNIIGQQQAHLTISHSRSINQTVSLRNYSAGVYIISIAVNGQRFIRKVVKQ